MKAQPSDEPWHIVFQTASMQHDLVPNTKEPEHALVCPIRILDQLKSPKSDPLKWFSYRQVFYHHLNFIHHFMEITLIHWKYWEATRLWPECVAVPPACVTVGWWCAWREGRPGSSPPVPESPSLLSLCSGTAALSEEQTVQSTGSNRQSHFTCA